MKIEEPRIFDPQTAPIEEVIEYLTVTLKKKWGTKSSQCKELE